MYKHLEIHTLLLICILLFISAKSSSQVKYWEDLNDDERTKILSDSNTYKLAVDYYNGLFREGDDSITYSLLDTLISFKKFNPLYFFEFNRILARSDGALAEAMGMYSFCMLYSFADEVINYLNRERLRDSSSKLWKKYAQLIGWEFALQDYIWIEAIAKKIMYKDFKEYLDDKKLSEAGSIRKTLSIFIREMEKMYRSEKHN